MSGGSSGPIYCGCLDELDFEDRRDVANAILGAADNDHVVAVSSLLVHLVDLVAKLTQLVAELSKLAKS